MFGFGKSKKNKPQQNHNVEAVIQVYGEVLEDSAPSPGCVADVSKLPFPKDTIKAAIITALNHTYNRQMKEYLKTAYISLSGWQEGVGETDQGLDVLNMDTNQDLAALAEDIVNQSESTDKWTAVQQKDLKRLQGELSKLGF